MIYVANLPEETVIPDESDNPSDSKANADGAEAIARVALAHADQVVGIEQEHGVPAVAGCLRARRGQDAVGAKVSCCGYCVCGTASNSRRKQTYIPALFELIEIPS